MDCPASIPGADGSRFMCLLPSGHLGLHQNAHVTWAEKVKKAPYVPPTRALAEGEIRCQEAFASLADASAQTAALGGRRRTAAKYKGDAGRYRREAQRLRDLLPTIPE